MPIPPLNERGLLPPGIHNCVLEDVPGWFGADLRRTHIWNGLMQVRVSGEYETNKDGRPRLMRVTDIQEVNGELAGT